MKCNSLILKTAHVNIFFTLVIQQIFIMRQFGYSLITKKKNFPSRCFAKLACHDSSI